MQSNSMEKLLKEKIYYIVIILGCLIALALAAILYLEKNKGITVSEPNSGEIVFTISEDDELDGYYGKQLDFYLVDRNINEVFVGYLRFRTDTYQYRLDCTTICRSVDGATSLSITNMPEKLMADDYKGILLPMNNIEIYFEKTSKIVIKGERIETSTGVYILEF